jgi:hypothetical protein
MSSVRGGPAAVAVLGRRPRGRAAALKAGEAGGRHRYPSCSSWRRHPAHRAGRPPRLCPPPSHARPGGLGLPCVSGSHALRVLSQSPGTLPHLPLRAGKRVRTRSLGRESGLGFPGPAGPESGSGLPEPESGLGFTGAGGNPTRVTRNGKRTRLPRAVKPAPTAGTASETGSAAIREARPLAQDNVPGGNARGGWGTQQTHGGTSPVRTGGHGGTGKRTGDKGTDSDGVGQHDPATPPGRRAGPKPPPGR